MQAENTNLSIWSQVCKTPTSAVEDVQIGNRNFTSIKGYYLFEKATEIFGPYGVGWGTSAIEETFTDGAPIFADDQKTIICFEKNHTAKVTFWYYDPTSGEKAVIQSYGHTEYVYKTSYGIKSDSEAPKKSLTDALKKALSMLGFAADVYNNEFSNPELVAEKKMLEGIEQAENSALAHEQALEEVKGKIKESVASMAMIPNAPALKAFFTKSEASIQRRMTALKMQNPSLLQAFRAKYEERLNEISPVTDVCCNVCGEVSVNRAGTKCQTQGCTGHYQTLNQQ